MRPVVSIVGRPNVGKSTLFNRLIRDRKAIVHDFSGVTRDRHYGHSFWNGVSFDVVDTGGYIPNESDIIVSGIREQVMIAIEESDVILFMVDTETGISDLDSAVSDILRKYTDKVLVVANKADNEERRWNTSEFYKLGFEEVFALSSINGSGTGELLDRVVEMLPEREEVEDSKIPRLAIIGRPNVGKSSFVNALLNHERSIVTEIAGTTRDAIDSLLEYNNKQYILVDTAGLRKRTKVKENIEFYSTVRTNKSILECDVAILMIDAEQGFEAQDIRVLREAEKYNKGIILVINKWDVIEKETNTLKEYIARIYDRLPNMTYIPIVSISALNKKRIHNVIDLAEKVIENRNRKISTSKLNEVLAEMTQKNPLPYVRGHQLKINYVSQVKQNPPVFSFFMNIPKELPPNYRRFIENQLRERYDFTGVPITMVFKRK